MISLEKVKQIMYEYNLFTTTDLEEHLKTSRKYFGILFNYGVYNTYQLESILKAYIKYSKDVK